MKQVAFNCEEVKRRKRNGKLIEVVEFSAVNANTLGIQSIEEGKLILTITDSNMLGNYIPGEVYLMTIDSGRKLAEVREFIDL